MRRPVDASSFMRAVLASPAPDELRGEAEVRAMFRREASRLTRRHGLRLVSGTGMTVVASAALLSMTAVTAAAYTGSLPDPVQRTAHRWFGRLALPAPQAHSTDESAEPAAGLRLPAEQRPRTTTSPRPAGRSTGVTLRVTFDPPVVTVGGATRVTATVSAPGSSQTGPEVATLQVSTPGTSTAWTRVGSSRIRDGRATVTVTRVPHSLRVRWVVDGGTSPWASGVEVLRARSSLVLGVGANTVPRGTPLTVTLTSDPARHGAVVLLQRRDGSSWRELARVVLDHDARATWEFSSTTKGPVEVRAVLGSSTMLVESRSAPAWITVT